MRQAIWPGLAVLATALAATLATAPGAPALAHHSFAPHFDAERTVELHGTVLRFDARNPHSYLHLEVVDEHGERQVWTCESHGVTMLERNGVTREILSPGAELTVTGAQARRDPHGCFFRTVELADGTLLSVDGPAASRAAAAERAAAAARRAEGVFGTWLLQPRAGGGGGQQDPMSNHLTEAGAEATAGYDPYTDDPVLRCDTIGIRRVWFAVGTPLQISRDGDDVHIRYEWMDAERTVRMNADDFPERFDADSLGYSIGRFEDDALVIETRYARGGVISQYVQLEDGTQVGLLHTDAMRTREEIRIDPETGLLNVTIDTHDPVYYSRPFPSVTATYAPSDLELQPFGCEPEVQD